ncbi:MAG: mechanosensitive ion channel family protein [Anaerolineae bacterium]|nr:mechanosensitive ion channel family protein [Anaerolineae bacterium]
MEIAQGNILLNTLLKLLFISMIFGSAIILQRLSRIIAGLLLPRAHRRAKHDKTKTAPTVSLDPQDMLLQTLSLERRRTLQDLIASTISVSGFIAAAIASLAFFTDVATMIWTVGFFTAGISFAAGPFVGDLLSGFSIIFQDKLVVGEKIRINSQLEQIEGLVESINLKSTRLRARTGEMYIVNNGELRYICNYSRGPFSSTSLYVTIPSVHLMPALTLLNTLGPEAQNVFPELKEPWLVLSETGTLDHSTQLTLALKTDFGQAARLRPKLMAFIQERFALANIPFA